AGSYSLDGVKFIQWGRDHENDAIEASSQAAGHSVEKTGFHLHSCGYLGAIPDGLADNGALIEIKRPFTFRNALIRLTAGVNCGSDKNGGIFKVTPVGNKSEIKNSS
ncbi:hypothetical protein ILUMI_18852, partial [Ignelater luminosus]